MTDFLMAVAAPLAAGGLAWLFWMTFEELARLWFTDWLAVRLDLFNRIPKWAKVIRKRHPDFKIRYFQGADGSLHSASGILRDRNETWHADGSLEGDVLIESSGGSRKRIHYAKELKKDEFDKLWNARMDAGRQRQGNKQQED